MQAYAQGRLDDLLPENVQQDLVLVHRRPYRLSQRIAQRRVGQSHVDQLSEQRRDPLPALVAFDLGGEKRCAKAWQPGTHVGQAQWLLLFREAVPANEELAYEVRRQLRLGLCKTFADVDDEPGRVQRHVDV